MWETPHQTSSLCFGEQGLLLTPSWSYAAETTQVSASGVEESHMYSPCRWLPRRGPCSSARRGHPGDRLRFRWDSPQLPGGLPHNLSLPRPQWGAAARLKPGQKVGTSGSSEFKTCVFHFLPCLRGCSENSSADLPKWKCPTFGHHWGTSLWGPQHYLPKALKVLLGHVQVPRRTRSMVPHGLGTRLRCPHRAPFPVLCLQIPSRLFFLLLVGDGA